MRPYESLVKHEGNAALFEAVEISIVAAIAGRPVHVHAEGVRGTGKTTIMRSAAGVLPRIDRITGCEYNCRPWAPHCPVHRDMPLSRLHDLSSERIMMPFLEVSHSAKLGTVVGSIDLAKVMDRERPGAAILLGTIPRANRGIVFIDEINRLADTSPELTDVLLDVMGTKPGRVQIEESGLPVVAVPVEISVWSASNPDEDPGPLEDVRRQLSDRFDLSVEMGRASELPMIRRILELDDFCAQSRQLSLSAPEGSRGAASAPADPGSGGWKGRLVAAGALVPRVSYPDELVELLAQIYVDFDIESIRAMESARITSRCRAALAGRSCVALEDIRAVLPAVLRHRVEIAALSSILRYVDAMQEKSAGRPTSALAGGGCSGPGQTPGSALGGGGQCYDRSWESRVGAGPGPGLGLGSGAGPGGQPGIAGMPGIRGMLHRVFERMKSDGADSGSGAGPEDGGGQGRRSAGCGSPTDGGNGIGGARASVGSGVHGDADEGGGGPAVCEACPPNPARPITDIGPKVVFAEDDLS
ncbi:MAG: hypothetical protein VB144_07420 [Clostridia bacterium]|nr:hypothetical protein [Clostridia bacterium]